MSNVLIGIIGVILFIGLALAGAMFFGPKVTQSQAQGLAMLVMQQATTISTAVKVRDSELETSTESTYSIPALVPNYLAEAPINPLGGNAPLLIDKDSNRIGVASFAAIILAGTSQQQICDEINRQGGGPVPHPTAAGANLNQDIGCFMINRNVGTDIPLNSRVAYATIG